MLTTPVLRQHSLAGVLLTRLTAVFFVSMLCNGCSTLPTDEFSSSLPPSVELTQTPFFSQETYQCGPAALATVLNHNKINVLPAELTPQVFLPERKGSLQIELAAAARRYGQVAYPLSPNLEDLLREVAAGNPVLVLQNLGFSWSPNWHYAVVVGYDLALHQLLLRSGKHQRRISALRAFSNTWNRASSWALVILPPNRIPVTAHPLAYLRAAFDLEATDKRKEAYLAYQTASRQWPENKQVWLALGNSAFSLDEVEAAHSAYMMAISLEPADSTIWNNLAYVYLAARCPTQAIQAINQALNLKPDDTNLLSSKSEIIQQATRQVSDECQLGSTNALLFSSERPSNSTPVR